VRVTPDVHLCMRTREGLDFSLPLAPLHPLLSLACYRVLLARYHDTFLRLKLTYVPFFSRHTATHTRRSSHKNGACR
jgi:hypothetical protein